MVLLIRYLFKIQSVRTVVSGLWGMAVAAIVLGLLFISWPYITAGYYIEQAGQALHQTPPNFQQVISNAEQAIARTPDDPFGYQLLGQIYLIAGNLKTAGDTFTEYIRLRPHDPAVPLALDFIKEWEQANDKIRPSDSDGLFELSLDYYAEGRKDEAQEIWQHLGVADEIGNLKLSVPVVTDTHQFTRKEFNFEREDAAGQIVLLGNSTVQTEFFNIAAGHYLCTIKAVHDFPPPVLFEVTFNRQQLNRFRFEQGDESWGEQTYKVFLPQGRNLLKLSFTNDFYDESRKLDRNGIVAWIKLERIKPESLD